MEKKPKIFTYFLSLLAFTMIFTPSAFAEEEDVFNHRELSNGTIEITGYTGTDTDVIIPNTIEGKEVSQIGRYAFSSKELTSVVLPQGLKVIDNFSFQNNNLNEIVIPESVTNINQYSFQQNRLVDITIEGKPTIFNGRNSSSPFLFQENESFRYHFDAHNGLSKGRSDTSEWSVEILEYVGQYSDVVIPQTISQAKVEKIASGAFQNKGLNKIELPDTIQTIGDSAFRQNNLSEITLYKGLTTIQANAFRDNNISNVKVPITTASVGNDAFGDNNIKEITLFGNAINIGTAAFFDEAADNSDLMVYGDSNKKAFADYFGLQFTELKQEDTIMDRYDFQENEDGTVTLTKFYHSINDIIIPDEIDGKEVVKIGADAFRAPNNLQDRLKLTRVVIPESIAAVGQYAFASNEINEVEVYGRDVDFELVQNYASTLDPFVWNSEITFRGYLNSTTEALADSVARYDFIPFDQIPEIIETNEISNEELMEMIKEDEDGNPYLTIEDFIALGVEALDEEDGDLTNQMTFNDGYHSFIKITESENAIHYSVHYQLVVADSDNNTGIYYFEREFEIEKEKESIPLIPLEPALPDNEEEEEEEPTEPIETNEKPIITVPNVIDPSLLFEGKEFTVKELIELGFSATDLEDGDISEQLIIKHQYVRDYGEGEYRVYINVSVKDSDDNLVEYLFSKTIIDPDFSDTAPIITLPESINASLLVDGKVFTIDELIELGFSATDQEDGDISKQMVIENQYVWDISDSSHTGFMVGIDVSVMDSDFNYAYESLSFTVKTPIEEEEDSSVPLTPLEPAEPIEEETVEPELPEEPIEEPTEPELPEEPTEEVTTEPETPEEPEKEDNTTPLIPLEPAQPIEEPEYTKLVVNTDWIGDENHSSSRPAAIEITITANGTPYETITLSKANNWTMSFEDLPKYDEEGNEILYSIESGNLFIETAEGVYEKSLTSSYEPGFYHYSVVYQFVPHPEEEEDSVPLTPLEPSTPIEEDPIEEEPTQPEEPIEEPVEEEPVTTPMIPLEPALPVEPKEEDESTPLAPLEPSIPITEPEQEEKEEDSVTIPMIPLVPSQPTEKIEQSDEEKRLPNTSPTKEQKEMTTVVDNNQDDKKEMNPKAPKTGDGSSVMSLHTVLAMMVVVFIGLSLVILILMRKNKTEE